jgi:hypothetical protein
MFRFTGDIIQVSAVSQSTSCEQSKSSLKEHNLKVKYMANKEQRNSNKKKAVISPYILNSSLLALLQK